MPYRKQLRPGSQTPHFHGNKAHHRAKDLSRIGTDKREEISGSKGLNKARDQQKRVLLKKNNRRQEKKPSLEKAHLFCLEAVPARADRLREKKRG